MIAHAALQSQLQLRQSSAQSSASYLGQLLRVVLAADDSFDHQAARNTQSVGRNGTNLQVGVFQHLLEAVRDSVAVFDKSDTIASEVPQLANRRWRYKTTAQQAMLQQRRDPL